MSRSSSTRSEATDPHYRSSSMPSEITSPHYVCFFQERLPQGLQRPPQKAVPPSPARPPSSEIPSVQHAVRESYNGQQPLESSPLSPTAGGVRVGREPDARHSECATTDVGVDEGQFRRASGDVGPLASRIQLHLPSDGAAGGVGSGSELYNVEARRQCAEDRNVILGSLANGDEADEVVQQSKVEVQATISGDDIAV